MKNSAKILFILCCSYSYIFSTDYGSYTSPSRIAHLTLSDGDRLIGSTVFYQGFTLTDTATTIEWDCLFSVSGTVTLNGGRVILYQEFPLTSDATIANGGKFESNTGCAVSLPNSMGQFNLKGTFTFENTTIFLNSPVIFDGVFNFQGDCIIDGNGNVLTSSVANIIIGSNATLRLKNMTFNGVQAGTVMCEGSSSSFELENVKWIQDTDYSFDQGSFDFYGQVSVTGGKKFVYASGQAATVCANATLFFDSGMTFSYDSNSRSLFTFENSSSKLHLYETTIYSRSPGLQFIKGTIVVEGNCPVENNATTTADGVWLGDGSSPNNINYKPLAESGFDVVSGYLVNNNV